MTVACKNTILYVQVHIIYMKLALTNPIDAAGKHMPTVYNNGLAVTIYEKPRQHPSSTYSGRSYTKYHRTWVDEMFDTIEIWNQPLSPASSIIDTHFTVPIVKSIKGTFIVTKKKGVI